MKALAVLLWLAATGFAVGCAFATPNFSDSDQWAAAACICVLSTAGALVVDFFEWLLRSA